MIPKVVQKFEAMREELRQKKAAGTITKEEEDLITTIKFVTNAFYGYMGFPGSRL